MYRYDEFDAQFVAERTKQFRGQVERRLAGRLSEAEFRPLRLMNGLYLQLHAYMLRVAIPYGTLNSEQFRMLAHLAEKYDRGYGHVTTRQNMQYNWPKLPDVPDMLDDLASVQMHAIQTSGNCIRNVTCDPYAGATAEEIEDPRPMAELIRQWSTLHPEFTFLPRKFKIAVTAAEKDRALIKAHDIGIQTVKNETGEVGYKIIVGGGLGRTPIIGQTLREYLPKSELLSYLTATLRIYNRYGRRDNKYKARIKILVQETGIEVFREQVEAEYATIDISDIAVSEAERERIKAYFANPDFETLENDPAEYIKAIDDNRAFRLWAKNNVAAHKADGYAIVNVSLKPKELAPGDITAGCINACGHHHVGHIGILGLEKAGVEFYQVKLGGDSSEDAAIGKVTGPGFSQEELIDGIENMVELYLKQREEGERFLDTYNRIGMAPFKEVLYA